MAYGVGGPSEKKCQTSLFFFFLQNIKVASVLSKICPNAGHA